MLVFEMEVTPVVRITRFSQPMGHFVKESHVGPKRSKFDNKSESEAMMCPAHVAVKEYEFLGPSSCVSYGLVPKSLGSASEIICTENTREYVIQAPQEVLLYL